jgi:hypothetical protein
MGKASFTIKMEECMRVDGLKIKWMGLAHFTISQANSHIRECGNRINFKEKANCIMRHLMFYKEISILKILMKSMISGNIIKVILF